MAVAGRKPVEDRAQVRHRNGITEGTEWREVIDVPFDDPPPLPERDESSSTSEGRPIGAFALAWPTSTKRWYKAVSRAPHAILWTPLDWEYVFDTAESHARFAEGWRGCASGAELRMREKRLGMTHDDRRDLRIRYVKPPEPAADLPENVVPINAMRDL